MYTIVMLGLHSQVAKMLTVPMASLSALLVAMHWNILLGADAKLAPKTSNLSTLVPGPNSSMVNKPWNVSLRGEPSYVQLTVGLGLPLKLHASTSSNPSRTGTIIVSSEGGSVGHFMIWFAVGRKGNQ